MKSMAPSEYALAMFYLDAKSVLINTGFEDEIEWQFALPFQELSETDFLREAAWVVFSSGFREAVVRQKFQQISGAFLNWKSATAIHQGRRECRKAALATFNNRRKVNAVLTIARFVSHHGFEYSKRKIDEGGVEFLMQLPYIGPITAFHLAKNIGLDVAKPDRHLVRAARAAGFQSVVDFCSTIHRIVGDPIAVVDSVVWRYATLNKTFAIDLAVAVRSCAGGLVT